MRLWEIKQKISKCVNENNQLIIDHEALYWNQAYRIKNYSKLMDVFDILYEQEWNDADVENINPFIEDYWVDADIIEVSASRFNQLNTYVSSLNRKLPFYYSILETMAEDQEEQIINIKIPEKHISSLKSLSTFNNRLDKIFKEFQLDGQFEFKWLDKWTSRYEIIVIWFKTYTIFIACLKIAKLLLEIQKSYYESKEVQLNYRASLSKEDDYDEKKFKAYVEKRLDLEIEDKVQEALKKISVENWKSDVELKIQLVKATKSLIEELWEGTEFHLSLNPPKYVEESGSSLEIDYKQISALIEKDNQPKWLENKTEDTLPDEEE